MFHPLKKSQFLLALGLAGIVAGVLIWVVSGDISGAYWEGMRLGNGGLWAEYCELNQMGEFIRQPVNSWSNLVYLVLGLLMVFVGIRDARIGARENVLARFPAFSILIGLTSVWLCFGSFFYHASLTFPWQKLDMLGTYGMVVGMNGFLLYRLAAEKWTPTRAWRMGVVVTVIILDGLLGVGEGFVDASIVFPALAILEIVLVLVLWLRNRKNMYFSWILIALVTTILGFTIRQLDVTKILCDPTSVWQGHAAWHLFTGIACFAVFMLFRSENTQNITSS